ncbi:MAG TPA: 50S ribosomal protein L10 [Phaeodactylibacter sp.]|nr:50S ribosomal protein L10 [Phaeodactylibacter sp.]
MTRAQKATAIEELKEKFNASPFFYLADSSKMSVAEISQLRRLCFEKGVQIKVVKNTLAIKALEAQDEAKGYADIYDAFKGNTTILFSDVANLPGKIIKEFRGDKGERPILKAAYIDTDVFFGDEKLKELAALKSKEDLIGEVISLLQSPAKNVISALQSGGNTLSGLLKALESRAE